MSRYGRDVEETASEYSASRRALLKQGVAVVGGGAAALLGRSPLLAQAPNPAVQAALAAAEAQRQSAAKTAGSKFKALVRHGTDLSMETLTMRPIHPQQVVVRNMAAQTCYTTTGALNPNPPANPNPNAPRATVAGHGGVGVVVDVGSQVKRVQPGDRVIMSITPNCGACQNCLSGRGDICSMFGRPNIPSADMADGTPVTMANGPSGYSEMLVSWEEFMVPVWTTVPVAELSLLACVSSTGLGLAMCRVPIEAGSDVAIFGLGPVGMSALQGARIQGAKTIIGIDPIKYRRDLAMKLGATAVLDPNAEGQNLIAKIRALTPDVAPQGRFFVGQRQAGPSYVIEAAGVTRFPLPVAIEPPDDMTGVKALNDCYTVVRGGGYVRTCGVYGQGNVSFPAAQWANSSKTHIPGNFAGVQALRDIPRFVRLIESGLFDAKSMIGQTFSGDRMRDALQVAADRTKITSVVLFDA